MNVHAFVNPCRDYVSFWPTIIILLIHNSTFDHILEHFSTVRPLQVKNFGPKTLFPLLYD